MTETALPRNVHARSDDGASGASYCNSTANIHADAGATSISGPLHCNLRTVDLALLGYRNFTTLGCAKPLEPHRYEDGVVSVSPPSFQMGVYDVTGSSWSTTSRTPLSQMPHQTVPAYRMPYSLSHVNITGICRVEQNVDASDGWNGGTWSSTIPATYARRIPYIYPSPTARAIASRVPPDIVNQQRQHRHFVPLSRPSM